MATGGMKTFANRPQNWAHFYQLRERERCPLHLAAASFLIFVKAVNVLRSIGSRFLCLCMSSNAVIGPARAGVKWDAPYRIAQ